VKAGRSSSLKGWTSFDSSNDCGRTVLNDSTKCGYLHILLVHVFVICSFSINATNTTGLGRMVNDSKHGNCTMKKMDVAGTLHLCLFTVSNVCIGQQLLFDYGDKAADYRHMITQGVYTAHSTDKDIC